MAVIESLHFACLFFVPSSQKHLGNLVSLDRQVQMRRVSTVFTLTLTLCKKSWYIDFINYLTRIQTTDYILYVSTVNVNYCVQNEVSVSLMSAK